MPCKANVKRVMREYGQQTLEDVCKVWFALGKSVDAYLNCIEEIVCKNECYTVRQLDISGNDVQTLGVRNQQIGNTLDLLLELVIEEKIENKKEKMIEYIKENLI